MSDKNDWFYTKNGLPPVNKMVLVWHKSWGIEMSMANSNHGLPIGLTNDDATCWRPLPCAPEPDSY